VTVTTPPAPELVPTAALVAQTPPPDRANDAPPPPSQTPPGQIAQTVIAPVLAATAQTQANDESPAQPAPPAQPSAAPAVVLAAAANAAKPGGQDASGQGASGQAPDGEGGNASQQGSARFDAPAAPAGFTAGAAPTAATVQTSALAFAQALPRTVTRLAADIAAKFGAKSTRFDVALEPAGLGKVDVKVHIGADGVMTAALNFDTSHAAEALKARAGELRAALEQAGFSLGGGALSFTGGGSGGAGGSAGGDPNGHAFTQTPFDLAAQAADTAPIALAAATRAGGVDIHI
jgi:flagellar hook-length control protein FliK